MSGIDRVADAPGPRVPTGVPTRVPTTLTTHKILGHAREHDLQGMQRRPRGARRPRHRRRGSREVPLAHVSREEHRVRPQTPRRRQRERVAPFTRE